MRQQLSPNFTGVFQPEDLVIMGHAYLLAIIGIKETPREEEAVARTIIRLYRKGMIYPEKLADLAVLLTSSRLFRCG